MLSLNFAIYNPFRTKWFRQIDYVSYEPSLTKNKALEIQITKWAAYRLFAISLDTCWYGTDHGGISFDMELFGYFFLIRIYDKRHWDHENWRWEEYDTKNDSNGTY